MFQQHFVAIKSQEDENMQGISVLQVFIDEGRIFANGKCMIIFMSTFLRVNILQVKGRDLFDWFGENNKCLEKTMNEFK